MIGEDAAPADLKTPYLQVLNSRLALARLASAFYGHPSRALKMIGVTGTSGKTSTTYLLESILHAHALKSGVIGTVSIRYGDTIIPSQLTTPGPVELQEILARMRDAGCKAVVMEVSSHALTQRRVAGIAFDVMVFNNLSPEHLDFHRDMEDYFSAKAMLFRDEARASLAAGKHPVACINADDPYGARLISELRQAGTVDFPVMPYSLGQDGSSETGAETAPSVELNGRDFQIDFSGIRGHVGTGSDASPFKSTLTGKFNASNILAAISAAQALRIPVAAIARGLSDLRVIPGRMQRVPNMKGIHVLVDYAHKPDALEKVLKTLVDIKGQGRVLTVFGCGGDRDRTKRPVMGKLAAQNSDYVYVTSDNPRTEDPKLVVDDILAGMHGYTNYTAEVDRRKAIFAAIDHARRGDLVLIAGKGHEDYQIIRDPADTAAAVQSRTVRTIKIHFDDREVAAEALAEKIASP